MDDKLFDRAARLVGAGMTRRSLAALTAAGSALFLDTRGGSQAIAQEATPDDGTCPTTTAEEHKALIERYWNEVWTAGGEAAVADLLATDEIHHWGVGDDTVGREAFTEKLRLFLDAFPDIDITVDQLVAEHDLVVSRWTARATHEGPWLGVAATGMPVEWTGVNVFRIACGQIAESWGQADHLGLLSQLGDIAVVPRGTPATPET